MPSGSHGLSTSSNPKGIYERCSAYVITLTQSLGLPTQGPKDRLIERHRQWVNVYNANLDAAPANRESLERLRRNLIAWDKNQDEASAHAKDKVATEKQYRSWLVRRRTHTAYPSQPVC